MKFLDYLREDADADFKKIIDILEQDCSFYLNLLKSKHVPFYRGLYTPSGDWPVKSLMVKKQVRQNREPKGMSVKNFNRLNKWLDKAGHLRRDNSVSATTDTKNADFFGALVYFFPIGEFDYTFIKAGDVNNSTTYDDFLCAKIVVLNNFSANLSEEEEDILERNFVTNKDIIKAHNRMYEIWFDCKEYYGVLAYPSNYTIFETGGPGYIKLTINPLKIEKARMKVWG